MASNTMMKERQILPINLNVFNGGRFANLVAALRVDYMKIPKTTGPHTAYSCGSSVRNITG